METPFGEISHDDIITLEYKLQWYLRYANLPTATHRDTATARADFGRQYERYVGFLYEYSGYKVEYNGLTKGLDDGGIDLIARKRGELLLLQCKRWDHPVSIDVVSRLHGAAARFLWDAKRNITARTSRVKSAAVLVLSGTADDDAKALAADLGIIIHERINYQPYPAIKAKRIAPKIGYFLLPFCKGYDTLTLNPRNGDQRFLSVTEALFHGFYFRPYHREIINKALETLKNADDPSQNLH